VTPAVRIRRWMAADGSWSARKMPFESYRIHEVADDVLAALDYCYEQGWTDGLPVRSRP
jgi:hypothetical protein